ncbi:MAG TPA: glutathione S-transferase N-terminal domain-containing protein [Burkholderiales bacterium]|nr:glutathione S-transferase N-terminal domain-containing protein [Burkholderiales bacterium]
MIQLWELRGKGERRYSLFSWRTRMALRHKGLEFDSTPVAMSDKAAIAFSGGKTVPIIKDGESVVRDSWRIAEYLEDKYAERPALFGGAIGRGVTQAFNTWVDRAVVPAMMPVIVADVHQRVDPADEQYFRRQFEGFLKCTLEEARERAPQAQERLKRVLEPHEAALKRQPFFCGAAPAYADYILFSVVQWARIMSPRVIFDTSEAFYGWRERILDLYDGFARNVQTG